jgi:hypothetical protein
MDYTVCLWSKAYAPTQDTDPFSIQVDQALWEIIIRNQVTGRAFLNVKNGDISSWIAPMGQPIPMADKEINENNNYNIYVPLWMLDAGQFTGMGEEVKVTFLDSEAFPEATHIVFKVVDSAFYNSDVKDELEKALTSIGVIQQHTTLQIPVSLLGGYEVEIFVSKTEPADIVLCHGEEVTVEFEQPVDHYEPPPRPPTPIPEVPEQDVLQPSPVLLPQSNVFTGQGYTLGTGVEPPAWRKGLKPPPNPQGLK